MAACDAGDGADGLLDVVVGEPGFRLLEGGGEALREDDLLEGLALGFEELGGDVGVAEALEMLDGRVLGEALFVPGFAGGLTRRPRRG